MSNVVTDYLGLADEIRVSLSVPNIDSYRVSTLIKGHIERKEKVNQKEKKVMFEFIEQHWIFDEYRKVFPHNTPSIFVQEQMLMRVDDQEVWRDVVTMWGLNEYRAQSVGKMLDCYDEKMKAKLPASYNHVRNQPTQREAIEAEQRMIAEMREQ